MVCRESESRSHDFMSESDKKRRNEGYKLINIKKVISIVLAGMMLSSLSGCGKKKTTSDSSSLSIKVKETALETVTSEIETESEAETDSNIYVPDIDINFSEKNINLSQFTITSHKVEENDKTNFSFNYDISDLKLEKFINDLGLEKNDFYSTITSTGHFYFTAMGYQGNMNAESVPSVFPIEIEINGEIVDEYNNTNISNYNIKGIKLQNDFIDSNDYEVELYNGKLKFSMTKEEVKNNFGEGFEEDNRLYYKVLDATLIIEFSSNEVVAVYLIKN